MGSFAALAAGLLRNRKKRVMGRYAALLLLGAFLPQISWGCACGCGLFDVGTGAMFPTSGGTTVSLEYDFMDQNQNRNLSSTADPSFNPDKEIKTSFLTVSGQYQFNRTWGIQASIPYWSRTFTTTDTSGNVQTYNHSALGDIRLKGTYTGFSEDMTTGFIYGVKLPTGDSSYPNFDADTEIGTGSTDLLLGFYHQGKFNDEGTWAWFAQLNLDQPIFTKPGYLPGNEIDASFGAYFKGLTFENGNRIVPILQLLAVARSSDSGSQADPADSGYKRLLIAPGVETGLGDFRIYAEVQLPFYEFFNGYQLSAPALFKVATRYSF